MATVFRWRRCTGMNEDPTRTPLAMDASREPGVVVLRTTHGKMTNYNYLVVDATSRSAVLVDPSWQPGLIHDAVALAGVRVDGILLTHSHPDHIDLALPMSAHYGCPLWMSSAEIAASGFSAPALVAIDESPWMVGGMLIRPMLTPGHTPGCMCFGIGCNLFTGDVLFAEGCGICPNLQGAHQMYESLQKLRRESTADTRIYPGHSFGRVPGQRFADVLHENIYLQFNNKDDFAAFRLRRGQSREKLFAFQ